MAKPRSNEGLMAAVNAAGNFARLAKLLGVPIQNVCRWKRVPAEWVLRVERATGVPRARIRPDIYGAPRPRPRKRVPIEAAA